MGRSIDLNPRNSDSASAAKVVPAIYCYSFLLICDLSFVAYETNNYGIWKDNYYIIIYCAVKRSYYNK